MLKINLHINCKLHNDIFIKLKENYTLVIVKIKNIDYFDIYIDNLKKITFQPSKLEISVFFCKCHNDKNKIKKIKNKIKKVIKNPLRLNYRSIAKIIAPLIYPVKDYTLLVQELSPVLISKEEAIEILKILIL